MTASSGSRWFNHVAVLLGGLSAERQVSLDSGAACSQALESAGDTVTRIDAGRDLAQRLAEIKPEVCFNALHGREEDTVKRCPPFVDAMTSGFLLPLVCDLKPEILSSIAESSLWIPSNRELNKCCCISI